MKAALLREVNGPLTIERLTIDTPAPDEVLVKVMASGLCHSDLHVIEGNIPQTFPVVMGHEASGVVEAVGANVTEFKPGDHVVSCLSQFCGACRECLVGRTWLCENRKQLSTRGRTRPRLSIGGEAVTPMSGLGAFAEQMLVHRNAIVAVPREMKFHCAAVLGCAVVTGVGSVLNGAKVEPGSSVAVIGCGGVGLNIVQGARLAGAEGIIAIDLQASKLELAREFGATDLVDASQSDPVAAVLDMTRGGADYAFEAIGLSKTIEQAFAMIRPGRTAYLVGVPPHGSHVHLPGFDVCIQNKGVQGILMGANRFKRDIPMLASLYLRDKLNLDGLIAERIRLEDINQGFERMRTGSAVRSAVVFE